MESSNMTALIEAIKAQTEAITRLANSNAMLVQAMMHDPDADDPDEAVGYLDGTRP